jgi:hypothetical protein
VGDDTFDKLLWSDVDERCAGSVSAAGEAFSTSDEEVLLLRHGSGGTLVIAKSMWRTRLDFVTSDKLGALSSSYLWLELGYREKVCVL